MSNPWTAEVQEKPWFSRADWLKRHEGFLEQTRRGNIDVLFLGDSITEGFDGEIWQRDFAPLRTANFGIGGDEVQHVTWRVLNGEIEGLSPRVIVVLIGTNNIGNVGHPAADVAKGVELLIKTLRTRLPQARIILNAVFPRDQKPGTPFRTQVAELNRLIQPLADGKQVVWLDVCAKLMEPNGEISATVMPDFLHLTPVGYARWATDLLPLVRHLLTA